VEVIGSVLLAILAAAGTQTVRARYAVELPDASGDVSPIHSTDGDYPGFDVVKLSIKSDGRQIVVSTTLKEPPGDFASEIVRLHFDTDNNAATGAQFTFPKIGGFEYSGELDACVNYADRSTACAGGAKSKAIGHFGAIEVERHKGKGQFDTDTVVSAIGFSGKKASPRTPVKGTLVESTIDYSDLHVKPGDTIRIVAKESHSNAADGGYFPEILLTLK